MADQPTHGGRCHCGRPRYEVENDVEPGAPQLTPFDGKSL